MIEGRIPSFKSKRGIVSVNVVLEAIAALRTATEIGTCLAVSLAPAAAVSLALRPVFVPRSGFFVGRWLAAPRARLGYTLIIVELPRQRHTEHTLLSIRYYHLFLETFRRSIL